MKLLGIESSSLVASIAVLENDNIVGEYTLNYKLTHSQTIMPMLVHLSEMINLDLDSIDAIAVSAGPGSFTGLRIGVATAKGLALAKNKKLINVPTLDAMAFNLYKTDKTIVVIMDAKREQVYTGTYKNNEKFEILKASRAISISELVDELNELREELIFIGDGIPTYKEYIQNNLKVKFSFAPAGFNRQRASSLLLLAKKYYEEERLVESKDFKIEYLRKSQAERELEEKTK